MLTVKVFQKDTHKIIKAKQGTNLLNLLQEHNLLLYSPCGGKGLCGKCLVKIMEKERLACQVILEEDLVVEIPEYSTKAAQIVTAGKIQETIDPAISRMTLTLSEPNQADPISDVARVEQALNQKLPFQLMANLADLLRQEHFQLSVVTYQEKEVLALEPDSTENQQYGIAIDLGTTTIVGYLLDLSTGVQLGIYSALNPQTKYGADVITRIDYSMQGTNNLTELTGLIRTAINQMIHYFCSHYQIKTNNIYELTVVGNTIMLHLLAGLPVKNMALSPYIPVVSRMLVLTAKDLNLDICPLGKVVLLPTVSSFVGADTIGAILSCKLHQKKEINLLIDIGTNGEIVLGNKEQIIICSTAAGPALEGGRLECGIGGVPGAINRVLIRDDVTYSTIGETTATGICGSGIIDLIAELLKIGLITADGRMLSPEEVYGQFPIKLAKRIKLINEQPTFFLENNLYLSQKDVREVQLAKAAIAAGIEILIKELNVSPADIANLYLTGGFGNYMDVENAIAIGLIPPVFQNKIRTIGNGAGIGAQLTLLLQETKNQAAQIAEQAKYIELATRPDFQEIFINSLNFS